MVAELVLHVKPALVLNALRDGTKAHYASTLAKEADLTYAYAIKLLAEFESSGLVVFKKHGRVKIVELTDKGKEIALDISSLLRKFGNGASVVAAPSNDATTSNP